MPDREQSARDTIADTTLQRGYEVDAASLAPGTCVGRYRIVSLLGAGGMGVVYVAHDPELDRHVAVKLLRARGSGKKASLGRARLLREAQAMAKLTHPNVVTIYDVGEHERAVYLAMELIEGRTLGEWIEAESPGWARVLDVLMAAGRGLAAAHAKDIVHRDFKPDNVMVAEDGRVLVMDFGLARGKSDPTSAEIDLGPRTPVSSDLWSSPLTQVGSVVGTPAYMAPEQHLGLGADARTDQFSYAVSLYEALFRQRPFGGETAASLAFNVTQGRIRAPPKSVRVPGWLTRVCLRALLPTPEERFASMDAMLAAMVRGLAAAKKRRRVVFVGAFAIVGAAGWSAHALDLEARKKACEKRGDAIDDTWNDDARARIEQALTATGVADAGATANKVAPWLDAWSDAWRTTRARACIAAEVERALDPSTFARAEACLHERQIRLQALVDELARADERIVHKAVAAASSLPAVEPCGHAHELATWPMLPADASAEATAILRELGVASAQTYAGRYDEALRSAEGARDHARALGFLPLDVEARHLLATLYTRTGDYERAEALLSEVYVDAHKGAAVRVAADAATSLVHVVGEKRAHHAEALVWAKVAEATVVVLEPDEGLRTARVLDHLGGVEHAMGQYEQARDRMQRSLDLRILALGDAHPEVATALVSLAGTMRALGDYAAAKSLHERALAIREDVFGPEHPEVATSLSSLAMIHIATGDYADAIVLLERSRAIAERALGLEHPDLANVLSSLAVAHRATGDVDAAMALYERALSIRRSALGPDHPDVARALNNLATAYHMKGQSEAEEAALHEAIAIWERAMGPEHPEIASMLGNLAKLHEDAYAYDQARELYERALTIRQTALGPNHPRLAYLLVGLANVAIAEGRAADAVPHATRAVTLREQGRASAEELAEARFVLAQASWDAPTDRGGGRAAARTLAEQAAEQFRASRGMAGPLAMVERWLADHP